MLVTNKDIAKDIAENMKVKEDVINTSVVKDMMFYMRDIYEAKIRNLETEIVGLMIDDEDELDIPEEACDNEEEFSIEDFMENLMSEIASEIKKKEGK